MPKEKRTPDVMPSDELLFAAIDRAERHLGRDDDRGVLLATVKEHLGLPRGGWSTRQLRPQLDRLLAEGLLEQLRRAGLDVWTITDAGRRRLAAARRAGRVPPLPEAPQHRRWREARSQAGERIESFREDMRERLSAAISLLDAGDETDSDAWLATGKRLESGCKRLASATYCLAEWSEPDDATADGHEPEHRGRRDVHGWDRW